jgi:signal transduction histidine kinase
LDLAELADGAAEALTPVAARAARHDRARGDGAVPVVGDARALDRVLRNLLDNAVRHAPPNSRITIELTSDGDTGEVRVHDDGPGFPAEFVERAFDRFSRADKPASATAGEPASGWRSPASSSRPTVATSGSSQAPAPRSPSRYPPRGSLIRSRRRRLEA